MTKEIKQPQQQQVVKSIEKNLQNLLKSIIKLNVNLIMN